MKQKLTLLLLALCTSAGAWAQVASVETGVNYYWRLFDTANLNARYIKTDATKVGGSDAITGAGIFKLEDAGDGYYYIHEITTDKYVYTTGAEAVTNLSYSNNVYSNSAQVIFTGTKEETDYFKWQIGAGTKVECFFVSSKANSNAVIAAMGQGSTTVNFYQNSGGYAFANSQFIKTSEPEELSAAVASITSGGSYRIFTKNNGTTEGGADDPKYYLTTSGTLTDALASAGIFTFTATNTKKFTSSGNAWLISPDGTNYFTNPDMTSRSNNIRTANNNRQDWEAQVWYKNEDGLYAVRATNAIDVSTWQPNAYWTVEDNGNTIPDADYATTLGEKHYVWQIEPVVTYNLKYNGTTIATKVIAKELGDSDDLLPSEWEKAYCSYTYEPATIVAGTNSVDVTMTWDGPFDISTSYASAVWYCMQIGSKWIEAGATSEGVTATTITNNAQTADAALWAFIGNPYEGVRMVNKSVGNGYYGNSNLPNQPSSFTIKATEEKFIIENDNGILRFKNASGFYMELMDGVIGFTYDSNPELGVCNLSLRSYYCQKFIEDVYDWADANHRDEPFGPSETSLTDLQNTIISMFSNMTSSQYSGFTIPDDILSNIVVKYPSTGFYRIKNNGTGNYIAYGQPSAPYVEKDPGLITISSDKVATDFSSIIKLTGSSGTYKISTEGLNVQSQTTGNQAFPATSAEGVNFVFTSANKDGIVSITNVDSHVNDDNDGSLHQATGWTVNGIVNWSASADNSKWIVEEATEVTISFSGAIGGKSYATFSAPFDVTIGDGAKVYTVKLNGDRAVYSEIADKKIPAGAGVLLISETAASSVTATINTGEAFASLSDNDLIGGIYNGTNFYIPQTLTYNTGADGTWYLGLGNHSTSGIGFYQISGTTGANKAYLPYGYTASSTVKGFILVPDEDDATGIETIDNEQLTIDNEIYNLAGQRLNKMQKGINIVNGKKIMVK